MTVTSIDLDQATLDLAKRISGAKSNRDVVQRALVTLIAVQRQPDAVERVLSRSFTDEQIDQKALIYPEAGATPS